MLTDHRIQVYLPDREYKAIRDRARKERKSLAGLLREAARHYLSRSHAERVREGYRTLDALVGRFRDREGKTDVAERHDDHLNPGDRW